MINKILLWIRQLWSLLLNQDEVVNTPTQPNTQNKTPRNTEKNQPSKNTNPQSNTSSTKGDSNSGKSQKAQTKNKTKIAEKKWTAEDFPVPPKEDETRFHDLALTEELLHGIADLGFQYCSPIQAASLPQTLKGFDVIGQAQTGTGKTAAFLITIITSLIAKGQPEDRYNGEPRALIIAPTRELALQIEKDAHDLCKYTGLTAMAVVGGMDYQKQQSRLHDEIIDILVATPGRLIDFINKRDCSLCEVETLVIDEADRMLDMGFIPDVKRIVGATPDKQYRQTLLFSATFTDDVLSLARGWTLEPQRISIEPDQVATDTIDQIVYIVAADEKYTLLYNTITQKDLKRVIIFTNRRDETRRLCERLKRDNIKCAMLSGEVAQQKRLTTLENFKTGKVRVLVATDVAGRGIHVDGISHVINYALPEDPEDYVHRIGRTGRAGTTGVAISFACEDDSFLLPAIETLLGDKLKCEQPPVELLQRIQKTR
ncbi:MAG: ATP-dependent RNA helicase RhlB [Pseudomonadales bacterium]|nr:ATP-dependent RNA helicase RhlB [Pseudomonadales bacterium]